MLKFLLSFCLGACSHAQRPADPPAFANASTEAFARLVGDSATQVLDVRTAEEFAAGRLARAVNIDVHHSRFADLAAARLDTTRAVAVYCRSGRRSAAAAEQLAARGFRVTNLLGGLLAWEADGRPVER